MASIIFVFTILIISVICLTLTILYLIGLWKLFQKAGKNGWEAIVPFYNSWTLIEVSGLNWWYFLILISISIINLLKLFMIYILKTNLIFLNILTIIASLANFAVLFFIFYNLGKKFHKEPIGFGVLGLFFSSIVVMIAGFSNNYKFDDNVTVSKNGPIDDANRNTNNNSEPERYCLGCGQKLKPDIKFCENCGKKVE